MKSRMLGGAAALAALVVLAAPPALAETHEAKGSEKSKIIDLLDGRPQSADCYTVLVSDKFENWIVLQSARQRVSSKCASFSGQAWFKYQAKLNKWKFVDLDLDDGLNSVPSVVVKEFSRMVESR